MPDDPEVRWISRDHAAALLSVYLRAPVVAQVLARSELETRERRGRRGPGLWRADQIEAIIAELEAELASGR
jgi:hypothetical protein